MAVSEFASEASGRRSRAASADKAEAGGGCREAHSLTSNVAEAGFEDRPSGGGNGRVETRDGGLVTIFGAASFNALADTCTSRLEEVANELRPAMLRVMVVILEGFICREKVPQC
jgi:hypothetical protein